MNYTDIAKQLFSLVGPADNILSATHCMTRLRLVLHAKSPEQIEALKTVEGVLGVYDAGEELQVIFGPGRVDRVTEAFLKELEEARASASPASPSSAGVRLPAKSDCRTAHSQSDRPPRLLSRSHQTDRRLATARRCTRRFAPRTRRPSSCSSSASRASSSRSYRPSSPAASSAAP